MARTSSPFLLFLCGLLAGCCASPVVVGGRFEPRFEIQKRPRIALLSAVLEGGEVWAYGQPAAAVAAVCSHYQAGTGGRVGSLEEAPPALRAALATTRAALAERGYRLAEPGGPPPQAYLSIGLGTREGRVVRLGLHAGGLHEGTFLPRAISLVVAEGEGEDPCPLEVDALLRELVAALPPVEAP